MRLTGLDRQWSPWSERASVSYGALPPGRYVFEARARRQPERIAGGARFALVVEPLWYQRAWVQGLLLGAVVAALALLLTWRQRRRMVRLGERAAELDSLVQERTIELESVNRKLRELAERDGLTGVGNRRRFDAALGEQFAHARQSGGALALLLVDVDHFKAFNDAHGHLAGDELLKRIAQTLADHAKARGTTATVSFGEPVTASVTMRARIVDGVLQVTDTRANPAALRCTETEAGQYRLNYANACGEVNLELLYEPCAGRRGALTLRTACAHTVQAGAQFCAEVPVSAETPTLQLRARDSLDETVAALCELPGIGPWTAQYVSMRALREPDAFPDGDLGLMRALETEEGRPSASALRARAEAWRPWRAYAALRLWTQP